jgi:hypothetical protein
LQYTCRDFTLITSFTWIVSEVFLGLFADNTDSACLELLLNVDTESILRDGRYTVMRDITTAAAAVKNIKLNNTKQTNGTVEFHRLNRKQLLLNHHTFLSKKTNFGDSIEVYILFKNANLILCTLSLYIYIYSYFYLRVYLSFTIKYSYSNIKGI